MVESIDKFLNKLGIYDIVAVFFTGAIVSTITSLIIKYIYKYYLPFSVSDPVIFITISCIIGWLLQEIGSFIFRKKYKRLHWFCIILACKTNDNEIHISAKEVMLLNDKLNNIGDDNLDDLEYKYNYLKAFYTRHFDTSSIDRDQSMAAMARSLFIFSLLGSSILFFTLFACFDYKYIILLAAMLFTTFFMFKRFRRFTIIRLEKIIRGYIYYELEENQISLNLNVNI